MYKLYELHDTVTLYIDEVPSVAGATRMLEGLGKRFSGMCYMRFRLKGCDQTWEVYYDFDTRVWHLEEVKEK